MKKKLIINDVNELEKEFYSNYHLYYWLSKIHLLKNCHDKYENVKSAIKSDLTNISDDDYKRVLRTEMHFLYFQMVETLFEFIFTYETNGDKQIWINLINSDFKKNYKKIEDLNEYSDLFQGKSDIRDSGNITQIPLLRWIFYLNLNLNLSNSEWEENLANIKELLLIFASDFSDRNEYNAYKHALRFYNSSFRSYIGLKGSNEMQVMCDSNDSISYLEKKRSNELSTKELVVDRVYITTKPFNFNIDYNKCRIIFNMINNIIETRRKAFLSDSINVNPKLFIFNNIDIDNDCLPSYSLTKQSFSI